MSSPTVLVTGSCGLIGSEVSIFFARQGFHVTGIDDNHRAIFFGPEGDTSWVLDRLRREIPGYRHEALDIRDREGVLTLMDRLRPNLIIHTAAQPSHDKAAAIPFLDFEVNALGTLHLLEAARRACPESPFIHMSTNKVYGDRPNTIPLQELETRWDYADPANLGWFSRCQFYVDGRTGVVLQTPLTLGNKCDRAGKAQRQSVRLSIAKELPATFRLPGNQSLTEQVLYHLLFNFLNALTQTGVAVCGEGIVQPLAGRTETIGTRN